MTTDQKIFGVSEINQYLKDFLEGEPSLRDLLVQGEISNYKLYPSGHHYFTLKDSEGALRCVLFKKEAMYLRFRPDNGMKVIARGRISVFPRDGLYRLYCKELHAYGVGDLHIAYEQLKTKLWKEGLFDPAHKKPLPAYPQRIALITSLAGAVVHDMIRVIRQRYPLTKILLLPVRVQGAEAPPEIVGAIRYANRWAVADLIITGRGGGSIEDLWAFNDERVARAIYDSEIPVISAVGHEPDVTIADYVADVRAATPSQAGEIAVPNRTELADRLRTMSAALAAGEAGRIALLRQQLEALKGKRALQDPMAFLQDKRMVLDYVGQKLLHSGERLLVPPRQRLGALSASLDALSPLKVLGRGYAMVTDPGGGVIRSVRDIHIDDELLIAMGDGKVRCRAEEIKEDIDGTEEEL